MLTGSRVIAGLCRALLCCLPAVSLHADTDEGSPGQYSSPGLGQKAGPAQIEQAGASIYPDGTGLPPGAGNAVQGEQVYLQHCVSCHGPGAEGGSAEPLAGGIGSLAAENPEKTVGSYWPYATTLFAFNRHAMPMQSPGTLSDDEAYAVTAYLLYLNEIVGKDEVLDQNSLPCVQMPNRNGFIAARDDVPQYQHDNAGC